MRNTKKIIISVFSLALCILISFAWINELQNPMGRVLSLQLQEATVAKGDLSVSLSVVNEEDKTSEEITKLIEDETKPNLAAYENFAPGSRKKFRVDIKNSSAASVRLRVILSDIICESEELRKSIIIGTNGFEGFDANYPAPAVQNQMLSEGMDSSNGFVLVDCVEIPPMNTEEPVSIFFYVMFSASGSENLEDMTFSIKKINFLTL